MSQVSIGKHGEGYAANKLSSLGVGMVREIATSSVSINGRVVYTKKVAGDIRGVLPGGQSVLVEVKTRTTSSRLVWSDFEEHLPATLAEHKEHGGLSLVVWICELGIFVMEWPIAGLDGPGMGIGKDEAIAAEWKGW